ncbi:MAG: tRNA pseudouridine(38-40) synthase TruA [Clostridia bacterium]|nr:tRNA pseudouridine(38-40) synthase TruA [Clostridia bacterium]
MRIILAIQYDGKNFCGWQVQPEMRTVQQTIEEAIFKLTGEKCTVTASGRTDSGVHALCQIAHFDIEKNIPAEKYSFALNTLLPEDVKIIYSAKAPKDFHARFSAKKKTYCYTFYLSDVALPLYEPYAQQIDKANVKLMQEGAKYIEGEHDFACFLASNSSVKDSVRTVYSCKVKQSKNLITVTVCGNGFLYNMVRTIAGTLLFVGQGKLLPEEVKKIIEGKTRNHIGKTMPAKGLMLKKVYYSGIKLPKIY